MVGDFERKVNMNTITYHGYHIAGNKYFAIAINVNDPSDVNWFDIDPDVNNDAFIRAQGWAYEPED
jgi:hypothetical protein